MSNNELNIESINITHNANTGGYCCDFYIGNKKFYADISRVFGSECMIFEYDENDKIDWSGVYCNTNVIVSEEFLLRCIKEFAEHGYNSCNNESVDDY